MQGCIKYDTDQSQAENSFGEEFSTCYYIAYRISSKYESPLFIYQQNSDHNFLCEQLVFSSFTTLLMTFFGLLITHFYAWFTLLFRVWTKMGMKCNISIQLNKAPFKSWSWHPVPYLEQIRYWRYFMWISQTCAQKSSVSDTGKFFYFESQATRWKFLLTRRLFNWPICQISFKTCGQLYHTHTFSNIEIITALSNHYLNDLLSLKVTCTLIEMICLLQWEN